MELIEFVWIVLMKYAWLSIRVPLKWSPTSNPSILSVIIYEAYFTPYPTARKISITPDIFYGHFLAEPYGMME